MQYSTVHLKHCFSHYTTHIHHIFSFSCLLNAWVFQTPHLQFKLWVKNDFILSQDNHSDITDIIWLSQTFGPSQGIKDVILLSLEVE